MRRQLTNFYKPLPWQESPWKCKDLIMLLTGSAGGGKSRLAAEKVVGFCKKYPGAMGVVVRKTRESMTNSTVLFLEHSIIDDKIRHYPSKHRFEVQSNGNGTSIIAYGGMKNEEQREQIRSIGGAGGIDICWIEEANKLTEEDFNEILGRMRGTAAPWRQVILTTNPDHPKHWIYRRLIQSGEATVFYSTAKDNPHNPEEYHDALQLMTGIIGKRLRDGLWVQAEGTIYDEFNPDIHLVDWFEPPTSWRRIRVVDFGFTNPFVCQWWAIDEDERIYLYREIYHTKRIVEDHAKQIKELSKDETIDITISDHDAEDAATLKRHGVSCTPAKKDVSPGIQEVQSRLRDAGDGRPRLFIMRGALVEIDRELENRRAPTCTEDEFSAYVWNDNIQKDAPKKENDHGMDAMRYMAMYLANSQRIPLERVEWDEKAKPLARASMMNF